MVGFNSQRQTHIVDPPRTIQKLDFPQEVGGLGSGPALLPELLKHAQQDRQTLKANERMCHSPERGGLRTALSGPGPTPLLAYPSQRP